MNYQERLDYTVRIQRLAKEETGLIDSLMMSDETHFYLALTPKSLTAVMKHAIERVHFCEAAKGRHLNDVFFVLSVNISPSFVFYYIKINFRYN